MADDTVVPIFNHLSLHATKAPKPPPEKEKVWLYPLVVKVATPSLIITILVLVAAP